MSTRTHDLRAWVARAVDEGTLREDGGNYECPATTWTLA